MNALDEWVQARRDALTWLDSDRYVWTVFAGAPDRWYDDPATLAAATAQAHGLLRSDVLGVSALGPFSRHLATAPDTHAVCAALELAEPRRLLADTLDAIAHHLGGRVDLALDCPSPRSLLRSTAGPVGFDDLDDAAAALGEVIRTVADRPIRALQISCDTACGPDEDETDCWSSLTAAAKHYGWITAIRLDGITRSDQLDTDPQGDLLLLPRAAADDLPDDQTHGGGLPPVVWSDSSEGTRLADAAAKRGFRFGEIPHDARPEIVLSTLARLNASQH